MPRGRIAGRVYPDMLARRAAKVCRALTKIEKLCASYDKQARKYDHEELSKKSAANIVAVKRKMETLIECYEALEQ